MEDYPYQDLRDDIDSLISETINSGNSVQGGFGRVFYEYWLENDVLEKTYPTPRPMKLMAMVATLSFMKERNIELYAEHFHAVIWLLDNISKEGLSSMYTSLDISLMLAEAKNVLPESIASKLVTKFGAI